MRFSSRFERGATPLVCIAAAVGLAIAATPLDRAVAQSADAQPNDPLEPLNRGLYAVHRGLDTVIVRPAMVVYTTLTPPLLREGLRNVVGNLGEPITFVNDVLQGRPRAAGRTLTRFATNSSIGLGGVFDVAYDAGFPRHYSDFGQTLGRWGVGPGPYVFVPVLGPSSIRDVTGRVVDNVADPLNHLHYDGRGAVKIARPAVNGLELRAQFDNDIAQLDKTATDPYVTLRSAYLQNRQSNIRGGVVDVESLPSFTPENPTSQPIADAPTQQAEPKRMIPVASVTNSFFRSAE